MTDSNVQDTISHKGKRKQKYSLALKKEVIAFAEVHGNRPASRHFNLDEKRVREWRANKMNIQTLLETKKGKERSRLYRAGKKPSNTKLEGSNVEDINEGKRKQKYSLALKEEVIAFAEVHGNRPASRHFKLDEKRVREWRVNKMNIQTLLETKKGKERSRLNGAGKKPLSTTMEEVLLEWIDNRRARSLRVSCKLIMEKAEIVYRDITPESNAATEDFKASRGWLSRFMKRNNIHCLKEGQPGKSSGKPMLKSQLGILSEPESNPFECTDSDVVACPTLHLLDADHEDDSAQFDLLQD